MASIANPCKSLKRKRIFTSERHRLTGDSMQYKEHIQSFVWIKCIFMRAKDLCQANITITKHITRHLCGVCV